MLEPKDDPGSFQLATGQDHIEIVVKTVDMGDSSTPSTTMNNLNASNRSSNRLSSGSGRRGTVMQNMPFIPESPSSNNQAAGAEASGASSSSRFSFTGLSQSSTIFQDGLQEERKSVNLGRMSTTLMQENAPESDHEKSEASEKLLAQMREQFRKKEIAFKHRIKQLNKNIASANESCREKATELSFAYATTHNEYAHLEKSQREQIMKKDLQIKLLKDRIGQL